MSKKRLEWEKGVNHIVITKHFCIFFIKKQDHLKFNCEFQCEIKVKLNLWQRAFRSRNAGLFGVCLQLLCILCHAWKKGFSCGAREIDDKTFIQRGHFAACQWNDLVAFSSLSLLFSLTLSLALFNCVCPLHQHVIGRFCWKSTECLVVVVVFFFALCPRLHLCYVPTSFAFGLLSPVLFCLTD